MPAAEEFGVTADMVKLKDSGGVERINTQYSGPTPLERPHCVLHQHIFPLGVFDTDWFRTAGLPPGPAHMADVAKYKLNTAALNGAAATEKRLAPRAPWHAFLEAASHADRGYPDEV
jgi:hypothetical protein